MTGLIRMRYLAEVNPPTPAFSRIGPCDDVTFLPLDAVWADDRLDFTGTRAKEEVATGYTRFQEGDVLVPKITPTFQAGRAAIARDLVGGVGTGTTELHVLRPRRGVLPEFLWLVVRSADFLREGASTMQGVAGQKRVPDEFLREFLVPALSTAEQRCIVDYVLAELRQLSAIEAQLRRIRSLLDERRWAKLTGPLAMERSRTLPLRRVLTHLTDGPFGSAFSSADYTECGAAVVRLGNIGFGEYRPESQAFIPLEMFERFRRHEVREGDVLIAGLGDSRNHAGRACVAPDLGPAIVKGKCFCARVDPSQAEPAFIAAALSSPVGADALAGSSRGSTRSMINLEIVKAMELSLPPVEVQRQLMRTFAAEAANESGARSALIRQEGLLGERRRVLISLGVTGRLTIGRAA